MRKFITYLLLILTLSLLLTGCGGDSSQPTAVPPSPTEAATEPAAETVPPTAAAEVPAGLPYAQQIAHGDQSVYDGPGYDYGIVGTIRESGVYIIMEEAEDYEGILWGKLASGIGWVDLTEIRSPEYAAALLSANYADEDLMDSDACHRYTTGQEYAIPIAFRAYGRLRDVTLFRYEFNDAGLVPGMALYTVPEMTGETPLVAELDFPGDMTTYGISFVDEAGVSHVYSIYISGRNGALILNAE